MSIIETIKFKVRQELSSTALKDKRFDLQMLVDTCSDRIVLEFESLFSCEDIPAETFKYPKNTWNFFKQDYMPKWFTNYWPVEYINKSVDLKYVYKEYVPSINKQGAVVLVRGIHD